MPEEEELAEELAEELQNLGVLPEDQSEATKHSIMRAISNLRGQFLESALAVAARESEGRGTRLKFTPDRWAAARSAVTGYAPTVLLGTSPRALDRAAERLQDRRPLSAWVRNVPGWEVTPGRHDRAGSPGPLPWLILGSFLTIALLAMVLTTDALRVGTTVIAIVGAALTAAERWVERARHKNDG